jgi:hypothetical protein
LKLFAGPGKRGELLPRDDCCQGERHGIGANTCRRWLVPNGKNNRTGRLAKALTSDVAYRLVRGYSTEVGFEISAHALRPTPAIEALDHRAHIDHRHLRSPRAQIGGPPD